MADGEEEKPIADNERLDEMHIEDEYKSPQKPLTYPDVVEFGFEENELDDPTNFFFKYIFPDITGKLISAADCFICHFAYKHANILF